ncbi:hypothetical protein C6Y14_12390 [Streptomyces dioscori]|uniref:Phytase-like domain-containing protein n=1 Tax=Streptomyces dioscori TaxID=2109333 RepID=A0A2P8Q9P3_9ACTN|nr:esterase-like activity of phytase family protein [Streptomyces dioscori]PSM42972.1 hypothetical protein C6Y14_12390 [Streptomyces dioscori]
MPLRLLPLAASLLTAFAVTVPAAHAAQGGERAYNSSHDATHACSPRVTVDGFSDQLDKTTFAGVPVAELSGLTHDTNGQLLAVGDDSRLFTLDAKTKKPLSVRPLTAADGEEVDSEAVAVDRDGTRLIASETEPSVLRFARSGKIIGHLPVPDALKVAPAGRATDNLTFEGLALMPGGRTLVASMEGALSGDGADIRRFQTWQRSGSGTFRLGPQYAFRSDTDLDVSDITSTGDGRLIVLERSFTPDVGNTVRLYVADLRHASDVSRVETVTADRPGVRLATRTLLTDVGACPSLGAPVKQPQANPLLDNIEGVTVTGRDRTGRLKLLLVSDDNQRATQITRLYSLTARLPRC